MGGLGVRDPEHSAAAAYLACMVNMIDGNAVKDSIDKQLMDRALQEFSQYLGAPLAEKPTPAPNLQKDLTGLVYKHIQAALLEAAAGRDIIRLQSVMAPYATAWVNGSGMLPPLPAEQYRCALKWVLGIQLRRDDYCCTACGAMADKWGVHATSCLATGTIGRAHSEPYAATLGGIYNMSSQYQAPKEKILWT